MINNKFEKKVRFGGWNKHSYKESRQTLKTLWREDLEGDYDTLNKYYLNNKIMEPQDSQFMQPPISPPEAMGESVSGTPGGLSQEEMRTNLEDMRAKLEGGYQNFNSQKFALNNETKAMQGSLLQQIFDFFQSVGVDPSSPEEVQQYLNKLKSDSPEMAQQLEVLLQRALGEEMEPEEMETEQNMNINNTDETVPQNL